MLGSFFFLVQMIMVHTVQLLASLYMPRHLWTRPDTSGRVLTPLCTSWHLSVRPDTSGHVLRPLDTSWDLWTQHKTSGHVLRPLDPSWHLCTSWHFWTRPDTSGHILRPLDMSWDLKIPPGPLGIIPESARPVQVQEQVAKEPTVYTLNCPKSVILGQFLV